MRACENYNHFENNAEVNLFSCHDGRRHKPVSRSQYMATAEGWLSLEKHRCIFHFIHPTHTHPVEMFHIQPNDIWHIVLEASIKDALSAYSSDCNINSTVYQKYDFLAFLSIILKEKIKVNTDLSTSCIFI